LQLSSLSDVQKNELALLIAERGVVVFRNQDFKESKFIDTMRNSYNAELSNAVGPEKQKAFGQYFGRLHVHVSSIVLA
jgi:sulfonate dioxygenase